MTHPKTVPAKEKIVLPDNIMSLLGSIVDDIAKAKQVVDDIQGGKYQAAVSDALALVAAIVNDIILPRVLPKSKAPAPEHD